MKQVIFAMTVLFVSINMCFSQNNVPLKPQNLKIGNSANLGNDDIISNDFEIIIKTNRISGVAPLAVFFDVTESSGLLGDDYINTNFNWDFGDLLGSYNNTRGFVSAHVFENPGVYTVTVHGTDPSGINTIKTIKIEVKPFSGETFYIASSGDDLNSGSQAEPFLTVSKAISKLKENTRILFNRGDIFNTTGQYINFINGPVIIGAYGSGNKPILVSSENNWGIIYIDQYTDDLRIMDLNLVGSTSDRNSVIKQRGMNFQGTNILGLRIEIENVAGDAVAVSSASSNIFIFDSFFHDYSSYGCFSEADNMAFVGNISLRQDGNEHFYRTQMGVGQFLAFNSFSDIVSSKSAIQIRGNGTKNVVIVGNRVDQSIGVNPQNDVKEEYISYCVIEGNTCFSSIRITAKNIVLRNNLLSGPIYFYKHPLVGIPERVYVFNNTFYGNMTNMIQGDIIHLDVRNNCIYSTALESYSKAVHLINVPSNYVEVDYSNYYFPNKETDIWNTLGGLEYKTIQSWINSGNDIHSIFTDPKFISTNPTSVDYLKPSFLSPLIDRGGGIPVFTDFTGKLRSDTNIDIGAYEYF